VSEAEQQRIHQYLQESGMAERKSAVIPLTGDASTRRYFRVIPAEGPSVVLALHEGAIDVATLPFINVGQLFQQMRLPVPAVVGHSDTLGILALQDLGDVTLQAHLGAGTLTEHASLYRQAVAFIDIMQRRGRELESQDHAPYRIKFDVEKLTWELDYFVRHFLEGYRGAVLSTAERTALASEWAVIAEELAAEPRVLCHRDYHSRNLMVHDGQLYIIDFQDARLGPDTYDLVSLLRDSYVDFTESQVDAFIAFFLALRDGRLSAPGDPDEFRRRFDLMALQRNLKALGTFGFQTTSRQNTVYIQYIPRTLSLARGNLARYPRFARLRELLAEQLEELR